MNKPASSDEPTRYWEKRVLYAYLRMMGQTQTDAGYAVGRALRTVQEWEQDRATYTQAREEARQRWLLDIQDASRVTLLKAIRDGNGYLAMQVLERTDDDLAPAKQRHDVHLEGDGLARLLAEAKDGDAVDAAGCARAARDTGGLVPHPSHADAV